MQLKRTKNWLTESSEGMLLASWLSRNWYKYTKIPSETFTPYQSVKIRNKLEGVKKGIPDYMIILKRWSLLFIELKKKKWVRWGMNWSHIEDEQIEWIDALRSINNVEATIAHGWSEAVDIIKFNENIWL
jgi:hypothetical protein